MAPTCGDPYSHGIDRAGAAVTHVEPPQPAAGLASSAVPPAPIAWPPGVTAAACLAFDMDAEAPMLTADISAIERMKSLDGLWITTVGEVARHTASLKLAPRTCPQPVIPADAYWVARPD